MYIFQPGTGTVSAQLALSAVPNRMAGNSGANQSFAHGRQCGFHAESESVNRFWESAESAKI